MSKNMKSNLPPQWYELDENKPKKRRFKPSREKLRALARASKEGGRARCYFCHEHFTVTYMRMKKVTMWAEDWVCVDCVEDRKL